MNKLEDLIKKLCPNGVKYFLLEQLENENIITLGRGNVISKTEIKEKPGEYPVYSSSSIGDGEIGRYGKYMFDDERITWSIDGGGKFFYRNNLKYSVTNVSGWLKVNKEEVIITKYLYYFLINEWKNKTYNYTHKAHPSVIRKEYRIAVPPLEVQREIVYILDNFTLLSAELSAELKARQKQYEYYRDKIFSFNDYKNVEYKKLGDISTIKRGGNFQKKDFIENGYPCIHYGQIYTKYGLYTDKVFTYINEKIAKKSKIAKPNSVIMAVTSENIEDVCKCVAWIGSSDIAISGHTAIIEPDINAKYLSYYFHTSMFYKQKLKYVHGTKVIEVTPDKLNDIIVPVVPEEKQEEIVEKLDALDKLCNDILSGIPSEIEARQKQFEYYRDKLLTFKELK